ncbi:MAG: diguanylate cyclase, partial [Bacteroidales bacterium]|nr:diguanylate cyclase [Bacteroidales bacterium]
NLALAEADNDHPEAYDYISSYVRGQELGDYLKVIRESKAKCGIPVIASINCHSDSEWVNFAKEIEKAGADALEINILSVQTKNALNYEYGAFEKEHVNILKHLKKTVSLPIIMKLGNNFTNPVALVDELKANGADAVVLFNRFYPFDIDVVTEKTTSGHVLSNESEISNPLRWTGIVSSAVPSVDIAVSGGVHDAHGVVKSILAGASAVELCSVVFEKGIPVIKTLVEGLNAWIEEKGYGSIAEFKGKLNAGSDRADADLFERTQFIKHFGSKEI